MTIVETNWCTFQLALDQIILSSVDNRKKKYTREIIGLFLYHTEFLVICSYINVHKFLAFRGISAIPSRVIKNLILNVATSVDT